MFRSQKPGNKSLVLADMHTVCTTAHCVHHGTVTDVLTTVLGNTLCGCVVVLLCMYMYVWGTHSIEQNTAHMVLSALGGFC